MTENNEAGWRSEPPDTEGFWWLYGEEEFGTLGGNYTGVFPPEERLMVVDVQRLGSSLCGVARGRMISLTPFDRENRLPGYIGKWRKVDLPPLPAAGISELVVGGDGQYLKIFPPGYLEPLALPVITTGIRDKTGNWSWNGSLEKPTLRPSILTLHADGSMSHLWLTDGICHYLDDSADRNAGKSLPLQHLP